MRSRRRRALKLVLTVALAALYFLPIYWMAKSSLQVEREITLIWRQGVRLPAAAVAFLDLLRATGRHVPEAS